MSRGFDSLDIDDFHGSDSGSERERGNRKPTHFSISPSLGIALRAG